MLVPTALPPETTESLESRGFTIGGKRRWQGQQQSHRTKKEGQTHEIVLLRLRKEEGIRGRKDIGIVRELDRIVSSEQAKTANFSLAHGINESF